MKRWKTREVRVGNIGIGGDNPIRVQSMTSTATSDVDKTVAEIIELVDKGCELVRVAVQGNREVKACFQIKSLLLKMGYKVPLIADIHFYPPAAMKVVECVDKVRINPGNFLKEKFAPLVLKCKELKRAIRIGVNHGSLNESIDGMVKKALEYAYICVKFSFHNFVFSIKSSDPKSMILAHKLLVKEMIKLGWNYPLHLGVTEAGAFEEGRIKSAVGIGALLLDGIGDTIRVSLTEKPLFEIEPCKQLIAIANKESFFSEKNLEVQEKREVIFPPKLQPFCASREEMPSNGIEVRDKKDFEKVKRDSFVLLNPKQEQIAFSRSFFDFLKREKLKVPVVLNFECDDMMEAASKCGLLLLEGYGEGLLLKNKNWSLNILQGCRLRFVKTEFISCPGCGRTLFDIQSVLESVRKKMAHLPGIKIAIMGCIVNGSGEMRDADFGYVGSKPGKVDLFYGAECVERDIDESIAVDRLIDLIKSKGKWICV